jgi:phage terminase large subunit
MGPFVMGENYSESVHNKTDNVFHIGKSIIEFFSADDPGKVRGGRRDFLLINECNNIPEETCRQLMIRTRKRIGLDFNPVSRFWVHDLQGDPDFHLDISTYRDNQFLEESIIKEIEKARTLNPNWYKVFGLGEIGSLEGLILPDFELIDKMPDIDTDIGLDFGFTNDPSSCVEVGINGGYLYVNELFYGRGMMNSDIIAKFRSLNIPSDYFIFADSAEPKSIEEIHRSGYNCKPCYKGPDSFKIGVDNLRRYKIRVVKGGTNVVKDLRNAMWDQDKAGKLLNVPAKGYLHSIDAIRYAVNRLIKPAAIAMGGTR